VLNKKVALTNSEKKYRCSVNISEDDFVSLSDNQEEAFSQLALKIYNYYFE
jgi:hypothetical protein